MDRVFSVDEMSDPFWTAPGAAIAGNSMNRSSSEWAFQRFLQEASVGESHPSPPPSSSSLKTTAGGDRGDLVFEIKENESTPKSDPLCDAPVDSDEYQEMLKRRLNLACAAVALARVIADLGHLISFLPSFYVDFWILDFCWNFLYLRNLF